MYGTLYKNPDLIDFLWEYIESCRIKSIVDLGCGFGNIGYSLRLQSLVENQDQSLSIKELLNPDTWYIKIDGVEVNRDLDTPILKYIYDNVFFEDIRSFVTRESCKYNLGIAADVLEHLSKKDSVEALNLIEEKCDHVFLSVPSYNENNTEYRWRGSEHEIHKCFWSQQEFLVRGYTTAVGVKEGALYAWK